MQKCTVRSGPSIDRKEMKLVLIGEWGWRKCCADHVLLRRKGFLAWIRRWRTVDRDTVQQGLFILFLDWKMEAQPHRCGVGRDGRIILCASLSLNYGYACWFQGGKSKIKESITLGLCAALTHKRGHITYIPKIRNLISSPRSNVIIRIKEMKKNMFKTISQNTLGINLL